MKAGYLKNNLKAFFSVFLVLAIILTMQPPQVFAGSRAEMVAQWDFSSDPDPTRTLTAFAATGGANAAGASLSTSMGSRLGGYTPGNKSIYISGWENGADIKYWQLTLSAKGYENLRLSFNSFGSGTAPRDFKLQCSTDGINFADVPNGDFQSGSKHVEAPVKESLPLPSELDNSSNISILFLQTSNISIGSGTVGSGGNSRLYDIKILGDKIEGDIPPTQEAVGPVAAEPANGASIAGGSRVTLTTATGEAAIEYTLNGGSIQTINGASGTVVIDEFNQPGNTAVIRAKAVNGTAVGPESTFIYKQAQVEPVSADRSGKIQAGSEIGLSTATSGASISYILITKAGLPEEEVHNKSAYLGPVTLEKEMFPARILAAASAAGYLDSVQSAFDFALDDGTREEQVYFGQLHSHTNQSDGSGTLKEAYEYARNVAKLDFFAVTDHSNYFDTTASPAEYDSSSSNTKWQQCISAADAAATGSFVALYGYEMTWTGQVGHMNTFNTEGFVSRNNPKYTSSFAGMKNYYELLKTIPMSISQFNHPGKTFGDFNNFSDYDAAIDAQISLVEVGNGEGAIGSGGYFRSYEYYTRALDKGWHLAPTNNQDNHKGLWGTANTARTAIITDNLTRAGVYDALKKMRVYATEDSNLKIKYTANDQFLGTVLPTDTQRLNIRVELLDPDAPDKIGRVSLVTNGGRESHVQNFDTNTGVYLVNIEAPAKGYYYIKVVEADGDIAVTAPVWIGSVEKVGIASAASSVSMPVTGETLELSTEIFNNESETAKVDSITYKIGGNIFATGKAGQQIAPLGTLKDTISYTPSAAGVVTVEVSAEISLNSLTKIYTETLTLDVRAAEKLINLGIDASHLNEYVAGNYANSMTNFAKLAEEYDVRLVELKGGIASQKLEGLAGLILTPPNRKTGIGALGEYSDAEIQAVKDFCASGKTLIVCGLADYGDGRNAEKYHAAYQQNQILEAVGAKARLADDEVIDNTNYVPTQNFRLRFKNYNLGHEFLKGVNPEQEYSFYSGASIYLGDGDNSEVTVIVASHSTSESLDSDKDGRGGPGNPVASGNIPALAVENVSGGARVFVAGTVFMSNFEVQAAIDNSSELNYSNYAICQNIVKSMAPEAITPISQVQSAGEGEKFTVQGVVTSNSSGYQKDTAFFDCIYIQDETAGINLFPVSGDYRVGQKVQVTGTVGGYQGEKQLTVKKIELLDPGINQLPPAATATGEAGSEANRGRLVKVQGVVKSVGTANGIVETIVLNDGSGDARVFIDGYINPSVNLDFVREGQQIQAVGLGSVDTLGARLRVRDRNELQPVSDTVDFSQTSPASASQRDIKITQTSVEAVPTVNSSREAVLRLTLAEARKLVDNAVAAEKDGKAAVIDIRSIRQRGTIKSSVRLENELLRRLADETGARFRIDTGLGAFEFTGRSLDSIADLSGGQEISFIIEEFESELLPESLKKLVGGRPVYDVGVWAGNSSIQEFGVDNVRISIPFSLKDGENPDAVVVYFIDQYGKASPVTGIYNRDTGEAVFMTNHLSIYAVGCNFVDFIDTSGSRWKAAIDFTAARQLMAGMGNGKFGTELPITRAMLVTVLGKMANAEQSGILGYSDVRPGQYYTPYIAWAEENGIAAGTGKGRFSPQRPVTREELAVILNNFLKYENSALTAKENKAAAVDQARISPWARAAVEIVVSLGLLELKSDNSFEPYEVVTRAEFAAIIKKYTEMSLENEVK
ncbi:endo-1,4-beta-xylanase A precursor [Ruminiclostridium hungatei]|uniref:Endo-1,4-beta-xylanase A n=1 Tax=Ruminiclostridium hungatei TaxID=48256 RepID=A0A1V4SGA4_RUMHU|nr:CehA/McbA family metallohydrolase [Ruminiclostridium hungatei]OPX42824.1 endo-1,4-beta-xylanase A precursor [Ruminiclostridium hungatei]